VRRLVVSVALVPLVLSMSLLISVGGSGVAAANSTSQRPQPAGRQPSPIALMVCEHKVHGEINQVLGVTATVSGQTWANHKYSCRYGYPNGSFELSVQELSSWSQTLRYFHGLGTQLGGHPQTLAGLGQGAFRTAGGDVVVRKDWKVLLVNVDGLPPQFGVPPTSATDVAYTVADVVLGCWAGD
jgi:hypothetical protein